MHPEHLAEKLVCEWERVAVNAIMGLQQPSRAPLLHFVQPVARSSYLSNGKRAHI
jgi:hypothetical protein